MLKITASLADGIPVDLRDTFTDLDEAGVRLLLMAIATLRADVGSHRARTENTWLP
jgi:hypothetical protein